MKTIKILSVDFDYFMDTDLDTRNDLFPNGFDEMPLEELNKKWNDAYVKYPQLKDIGLTSDYDQIKDILSRVKGDFFVSPTHKDIKQLLDNIPLDVQIEIVNVDFHHDMYCYYSKDTNYNCSTWLRRLIEERPYTRAFWCRREDSDTRVLWGEVEIPHTIGLDVIKYDTFDMCFICESPEWSLPHLHSKYEELIEVLRNKG